jgi:hypothetical protein
MVATSFGIFLRHIPIYAFFAVFGTYFGAYFVAGFNTWNFSPNVYGNLLQFII